MTKKMPHQINLIIPEMPKKPLNPNLKDYLKFKHFIAWTEIYIWWKHLPCKVILDTEITSTEVSPLFLRTNISSSIATWFAYLRSQVILKFPDWY